MSTLDDLSALAEPEDYRPQEKETLLSKYRIPIQHFEYEYIEACKDGKELERIYQILKSGEEGHYPDLLQTTEERLKVIKPKSRLLRKLEPVVNKSDLDKEELNEICEDLNNWMTDISKHNKELERRKVNSFKSDTDIRIYKELTSKQEVKCTEKRIKSTDYTAWDKYDPDTELLKMDLAEENKKKTLIQEMPSKKPARKSVRFNKFTTEAEATFVADREKEKGNEFFKAGDYEEALQCYTNSITSKACVNNLNNRAVTYIKLKKYGKALEDCDKALVIDGKNLKTHLRKVEALEGLKQYQEALECVDFVIQGDPNNEKAQELAERLRRYCEINFKNTRMKIVEIE